MAISYSVEEDEYITNEYSWKRLEEDKYLVTTMHGGWAILNQDEFRLLRYGKVDEDIQLYNLLKDQGILITEKNSDRIVQNYRDKYAQLFQGTTLHIMTPTLRCNQKCIYCGVASKPYKEKKWDMDRETAREIVDFIMGCPADSITIEFQGGEPTLNFDIIKFVTNYSQEKAEEAGKDVSYQLVTNLTKMTDDKLDFILDNDFRLNSSLDGPKHVHNHNRPYENGEDSWEDVVHWIKKLVDEEVPISCMPTITRYSLKHWKEIIDEYNRLGLNRFWVRKLNVGGFATEGWDEIGYTPEEFLDFWKKCVEYIFELNRQGEEMVEGVVDLVGKQILMSKKYQGFVCQASPCGAAWGQVSYDNEGNIYTCDEARSFEEFKLGNVKETTYKELYSSPEVMDIVGMTTGMSFDCADCVYHPFCGPCIVDNYGEYGNVIQRGNSYNCKIKKGFMDYIFKEIIPNEEKFEIMKKWVGLRSKD